MREKFLPVIVLITALILETSLTTLPLIVGVFIFLTVVLRQNWIFPAAFFTGIIFDILSLRAIGGTSIFLTLMIFIIYLYENKFETATFPFIFIFSFISSFIFLIILGYQNFFIQSFVVSILTALFFQLLFSDRRDKINS